MLQEKIKEILKRWKEPGFLDKLLTLDFWITTTTTQSKTFYVYDLIAFDIVTMPATVSKFSLI